MKLTEIKNNIAAICKQYNISNYKINLNGTVDVNGDVDLSRKKFSTLPLKFGKVTGDFYCSACPNLTSLEGAPSNVGGDFYCSGCPNLTSLVGASGEVGGSFYCGDCLNLTSLEGAPSKVGGDFYCGGCSNLTSLHGVSSEVNGNFYCRNCSNLTSLEGAPNEVGGDFYCYGCPKLTKLSHLGSINRNLYIGNTPITNLLAVFNIENLKEIVYGNDKITNIINKHLKNPDRDEGMFQCRQELRDAGFNEYVRLK